MTHVWLIRHAQASFGADDYDRLSALGHDQSRRLGAWLAGKGVRPARLVIGAQRRHRETAEGLAAGYAEAGGEPLPASEPHPGFNEYDADGLFSGYADRGGAPRPAADDRRAHFKLLSEAIAAWQDGLAIGSESWAEFEGRTGDALDFAADGPGPVLAVTSGGVIGRTAAALVGAGPAAMIRFHMQVKNAGFSRIVGKPGRLWLNSFNEAPHLEDEPGMLTYS